MFTENSKLALKVSELESSRIDFQNLKSEKEALLSRTEHLVQSLMDIKKQLQKEKELEEEILKLSEAHDRVNG